MKNKPRNRLVPLMFKLKSGAHRKTNKALRKMQKQELNKAPVVERYTQRA